MNYINHFISDELTYALGWTVIHSIWQAMIIALLVSVLMIGFQKQSAKTRYTAYYIGLVSVLFLSVITFIDLYQWGHDSNLQNVIFINDATILELQSITHHDASFSAIFVDYFNQHMPLIVLIWLSGMAFFVLRLLGGIGFIQYIKYNKHTSVSYQLKEKMWALMERIPIERAVQLVESSMVNVPLVVGYFKPIILLPLGTINQLHPKELEAILAHELAHIARNDYLLNVLQSVIEVLFYYNPAVWWLSANIRSERENCCDDIAVKLCGNSLTYAKALVSLQEINFTPPMLALPFSGKKNQLLQRVQRILNQPQNRNNIMEKLMATCLLLLTIGLLTINAKAPDWYEGEDESYTEIDIHTAATGEKEITVTISAIDTVPKTRSERRERIVHETDETRIEFERINGEIQYVEVNGKEVPEEEWDEYMEKIESLAPPAPTKPSIFPVPPAPPAPPTRFKIKKKRTISTQDEEDGSTLIIIEKHNGEAPTHIRIDEGEAIVKIDGKKIPLGETFEFEGEEIIIDGTATFLDNDSDFFEFPDMTFELGAITDEMENSIFEWNTQNKNLFEYYSDIAQFPKGFGDALREGQKEELEHLFENRHELFFEQREQADQLRAEARELLEHYKDEQKNHLFDLKERSEELRFETKERMRAFQEEYKEQLKQLQAEAEAEYLQEHHIFEFNNQFPYFHHEADLSKVLASELYKDGLIKTKNKFRFQLTKKELKVNGKLQSSSLHDKYMELYESLTDSNLCDDCEVNIRHKGKGNQQHRISKEL